MYRLARLALALAVLAPLSQHAPAARAYADLSVIDPTLSELQFGQGFEAISKWVGKRLDKVYLPRIAKATDANERARLRARREQEIALMKNAEVLFDGRDTGFEASIIQAEFGVGTDESLYQYKEGEETHFFFMHEGKLWKYARVLAPKPAFLVRVGTFQTSLGEPAEMADEADGSGGRAMASVTWKNAGFDLRLLDRRLVYGGDLVVIEDRAIAAELTKARAAARPQGLGGVSKSLEGFLLEDPDTYGSPPPPKDEPTTDPKQKPKGGKGGRPAPNHTPPSQ